MDDKAIEFFDFSSRIDSFSYFQLSLVISGAIGNTSKEAGTFFGDTFETVRSTTGGFLELLVDLNDQVTPAQKVAIQRNSFGDVVAEYQVSVAGEVATIARDALSEPGSRVMQILYSTDAK